jgi:hypothetical protein
VRDRRKASGWLVAVYLMLAILPQATLLLAAGGLVDTWVDFRRRLARANGPPDNETKT